VTRDYDTDAETLTSDVNVAQQPEKQDSVIASPATARTTNPPSPLELKALAAAEECVAMRTLLKCG
jgi:hypothetical protein